MSKEQLIKEIYTHVTKNMGVDFKSKQRHEDKIVALDLFQNICINVLKPFFVRDGDLYIFIGKFTNRDRTSVICSKNRIELKLLQFSEFKQFYKESVSTFKKLSGATDLHDEIRLRQNIIKRERRKINQLKKELECI